jgi:hypothetical protein
MATAPPPKSGAGAGSFFTKKVGPLPMWGWIAVAIVGVILYRKMSGSGSAGSVAGSSTNAAVPTETVTTAAGTYSGPVGYDPLGGGGDSGGSTDPGSAGGSPGATTSGNSTPGGVSFVGSGYQQNMASVAGQGNYILVQPGQSFPTGTETYAELTPGAFTAIPGSGLSLAPNTPQYVLDTTGTGNYQKGS